MAQQIHQKSIMPLGIQSVLVDSHVHYKCSLYLKSKLVLMMNYPNGIE
jgi:hypothetical protein